MSKNYLMVATLLVIASLTATACSSPHLYSQPGRVAALEAAKTLDAGEQSVGAQGGVGHEASIDLAQISAKYRYGLSDQIEVGVDGNLRVVTNMEELKKPVNSTIWSTRVGAKWAPALLQDYVAVTGGVAGGTYAAGQFLSPDLGVVLAFENPYVVPFVSATGYVSVPVNAQAVDVTLAPRWVYNPSTERNELEERPQEFSTPETTWGVTGTAGIRVPVDLGKVTLAPSIGVSLSEFTDGTEASSATAANLGMDVVF